ncbi:MAG TPA: sigma factor-like helix-turn-helix DNA-binding protein, partial [Polyangiaceae bacterium]|nr:sigma factor-like helix-turn-helix DNA-binding protein [Polyangiaceae bacterium]
DDAAPPARAAPSEDEVAVRRAVARLPHELATLMALGYEHGFSSSEMAARVHVPVGTVKSRVARALASLRQVFGEDEAVHP